MKSQNIYKIILLVVALAFSAVYLYIVSMDTYSVPRRWLSLRQQGNEWKSCDNLENFINSTIQKANYCTKDEDCIVSNVGKIPCNCWSLVNKEADLNHNPVQQAVAAYQKQECSKGILCKPCDDPPTQAETACQSNVCVTKNIYIEPKVYVLTDKKNYKLEESVQVIIKNNIDHEVAIPTSCGMPFTLLAYDGLKWIKYGAYPIKDCESPLLILASTEQREFTFTLEQVYEYSSFIIKPGVYKLLMRYTTDPYLLELRKIGYNEAFSDEFTIAFFNT